MVNPGLNFVGVHQFVLGNAGPITHLKLVTIDIKPGTDPNCINLGSEGVVAVAILATPTFDPASVDPPSLSLRSIATPIYDPTGDRPPGQSLRSIGTRIKVNSGIAERVEDVDLDLVVQFPAAALQLTEADTAAVLEGLTLDGAPIQGVDPICLVPGT